MAGARKLRVEGIEGDWFVTGNIEEDWVRKEKGKDWLDVIQRN